MKPIKYVEYPKHEFKWALAKEEDFTFTFDSPGQFIEFLGEWKAHYKELTKSIRYAKAHHKPSRPDYDPDSHGMIYHQQREARNMMTLRTAAKAEGKVRQAKAYQERIRNENLREAGSAAWIASEQLVSS